MRKVIYDAILREKLSDLDAPMELCDEQGRILARVLPMPDPNRGLVEPRASSAPISRKKVLYDTILREKLSDLDSPIELCDEQDRVLARILPVLDPSLHDLEPQISKEELRRRIANPGRLYTTAEVLAYLATL